MKKVIVFGLVGIMVLGMAMAASAAAAPSWLLYMRAGLVVNGSPSTVSSPVWSGSTGPFSFGLGSGYTSTYSSFTANTVCLYADTAGDRSALTNKQVYDTTAGLQDSYTWNLVLESKGTSAPAGTLQFVYYAQAAVDVPNGLEGWTVTLYQGKGATKTKVGDLVLNGKYFGTAGFMTAIQTPTIARSSYAEYTLEAVKAGEPPLTTPEPGSIVAMLSGLVGLAGFGIRRRK